ncbi:MAG: cupin domain-containing protein [Gammaproteobacteria bacterium]|nr:MAG: cupin domain-containing protein [Gammaproteobacteria bacterium]RLA46889.1 MAG: cupin domain-containing protein [Gammaproteobacteria bacterium]
MTREEIIERLKLAPHPTEGGYFKRTYASSLNIEGTDSRRKILTSIYYMLTSDDPHGYLHKNKSDIIHFHHLGSAIKYLIISPEGKIKEQILGPDIINGQLPQLVVNGGDWKVSQLCSGEYGLISEAVAPGFEYEDNEIATSELVKLTFPDLASRLDKYIKHS